MMVNLCLQILSLLFAYSLLEEERTWSISFPLPPDCNLAVVSFYDNSSS